MKDDDWGKGQRTLNDTVKLLQKFVEVLEASDSGRSLLSSQGQAMSGIEELQNYRVLARKARKLLGEDAQDDA